MQSFYESKYILHWKLELSCSTWLLFVFLVPGCYLYLYVQYLDAICICICKTWLLFVFVFVFLVHTWLLFVFVFVAPGCSCCSKAAPACLPDPCLLPQLSSHQTGQSSADQPEWRCTHTRWHTCFSSKTKTKQHWAHTHTHTHIHTHTHTVTHVFQLNNLSQQKFQVGKCSKTLWSAASKFPIKSYPVISLLSLLNTVHQGPLDDNNKFEGKDLEILQWRLWWQRCPFPSFISHCSAFKGKPGVDLWQIYVLSFLFPFLGLKPLLNGFWKNPHCARFIHKNLIR